MSYLKYNIVPEKRQRVVAERNYEGSNRLRRSRSASVCDIHRSTICMVSTNVIESKLKPLVSSEYVLSLVLSFLSSTWRKLEWRERYPRRVGSRSQAFRLREPSLSDEACRMLPKRLFVLEIAVTHDEFSSARDESIQASRPISSTNFVFKNCSSLEKHKL